MLLRDQESHMDINSEEYKVANNEGIVPSDIVIHPSYYQDDFIELAV